MILPRDEKPITFTVDGETFHAYECMCDRCRGLWLALLAETDDGYFFTDEEFAAIAEKAHEQKP